MCGIVGYIGKRQAAPILLGGMRKLEYRGYDSAGIAVKCGETVSVAKTCGSLDGLAARIDRGELTGRCGIGHTRWATHGAPTEENAHPHRSMRGRAVLVHNGILENYRELKRELLAKGYRFYSETDSEVIANLLEDYCLQGDKPQEALLRFMAEARGSYALAVLFAGEEQLFLARKDSPLVVGKGEGEMLIASDVPALLGHAKEVYYVGNRKIACVREDGVSFFDEKGRPCKCEKTVAAADCGEAEKEGYEHFMLKEIYEQPRAVEDTLNAYIKEGVPYFAGAGMPEEFLGAEEVVALGCGSAYHAALVFQSVAEKLARVPVRAEVASEFRYRDPVIGKNTLAVVISQSGETADTLAAMREAKARGARTLAVVNVRDSSAAREADCVLYTYAGPEIAVATTKAYSAQLAVLYLLALAMAKKRGLPEETVCGYTRILRALPAKMELVLSDTAHLRALAERYASARHLFLVGRGVDYAVCLEGALKLKETGGVLAEGYPAGELKHGAAALIGEGVAVIGILTQPAVAEKTAGNLAEARARGAKTVTLSFEKHAEEDGIVLPETDMLFSASLSVLPLQLFAYYAGVVRGTDVDRPRNLAKSVTVE